MDIIFSKFFSYTLFPVSGTLPLFCKKSFLYEEIKVSKPSRRPGREARKKSH